MKKIIFIGPVGSGKTTISEAILGEDIEYRKTQAVQVMGDSILDTPGEYLERVQMRGALMITSADAEIIGLIESATELRSMFPPGYAGGFAKTVIGIVTKTDIADEKQIEAAETRLKLAGVAKIFHVSSVTREGLDELLEYLEA